jgi:hypothetical protein
MMEHPGLAVTGSETVRKRLVRTERACEVYVKAEERYDRSAVYR